MKKSILLLSTAFLPVFAFSQTATNFNCNDCASVNHDLFTELNSGKVIVICWAMPCGSCIAPASTAATTVQGYASSNPGVVKFYLVDDYGNTSCNTLNNWATTNSIVYDASFSNASISMADYGTAGMPKTVVLGGPNHTVFLNQNGSVSSSALQTAINNAIASNTGITEGIANGFNMSLLPNPASSATKLSYTLAVSSEVSIEVLNSIGEVVKTAGIGNQPAGKLEYQLDLGGLAQGIYFVRLKAGKDTEVIKLTLN